MATTTTTITEHQQQPNIIKPPTARRVCCSFAAYSKNLIDHFCHSNVPIADPLTDQEIATIQSTYHFTFPPDLRSILQEGLPVVPGFPTGAPPPPNNSTSSPPSPSWAYANKSPDANFDTVISPPPPVWRETQFFILTAVTSGWSYDIIAFFQQTEFKGGNAARVVERPNLFGSTPACAATEARRIEFWTELVGIIAAETEARGETRAWWQVGTRRLGDDDDDDGML